MNLDEFLAEVRLIVDDPVDALNNPDQKFTEANLISLLNRTIQSLCRIQIQRDQGFHNFPLVVKSADAKQVLQNVFQWRLPTWVAGLADVRNKVGGDDATQPTFSPFMWTTQVPLSDQIQKKQKWMDCGWRWDGNRTFQMWGVTPAPTLVLQVAKLPARVFKATLDVAGASTSSLYLPLALTLGQEDLVEGAYINADVQITSQVSGITRMGQSRRCIYSDGNADSGGGVRRNKLTFDEAYPLTPAIGDVVQSLIPYGEEHARLLLLKVAWSCFEQLANIPAQKAIAASLAAETEAFSNYVTPRDTAQAESWHRPFLRRRQSDQDRSTSRGYFS